MTDPAVHTAVRAGEPDKVDGLVEWLRIPSISGDPNGAAYLRDEQARAPRG